MTDQSDEILTLTQQRRVVLAQKARGILTNQTIVSSSGTTADEIVRLAIWLEGPTLSEGYGPVGDDEPGEGWGDDRYTEPCCEDQIDPQRYGGEDQVEHDHATDIAYSERVWDVPTQSVQSVSGVIGIHPLGIDDRRELANLRLVTDSDTRPNPTYTPDQYQGETEDQFDRGTE